MNELSASIDNSSQTVKVNQSAPVKLSISESNYQGTFTVKYELIAGSGSFSGGAEQTLAAGTHSMSFTPNKPGTHTYKLTVTDTNNQTKIVNVTVIANASPLSISVNKNNITCFTGETSEIVLAISEDSYSGNFRIKQQQTGASGVVSINGTELGNGLSLNGKSGNNSIKFRSTSAGTANITLVVTDDFNQEKTLGITITATKITISASAQTGGTVTGAGSYDSGSSCTLIANTSTGYTFVGWYEANAKVSTNASYTFTVSGNRSLEARFTINSYTISTSAQTGGSASGGGTFNYGTSRTVTASANTGYTFAGWYESGTRVSTSASYTFTVSGNRSLEARFSINSYTISTSAQTGGSASGGKSYTYGSSCTITATTGTGYTFAGWYEGGTKITDNLSYTFTVTGNRSFEARFTFINSTKTEVFEAPCHGDEYEITVTYPIYVKKGFSYSNFWTYKITLMRSGYQNRHPLYGLGVISGNATLVNSKTDSGLTFYEGFTPQSTGNLTLRLRTGYIDTNTAYGAKPSKEAPNDSNGYLEFTVIVVD